MSDDAGTVTVGEGGGRQEVLLLTARAIKEAAATIARAVIGAGESFVIVGDDGVLSRDLLTQYRTRFALVTAALDSVSIAPGSPVSTKPFAAKAFGAFGAPIDALGRAAQGAATTIGLFKSDYYIGGTDATPDRSVSDSLLCTAVAGALLANRGRANPPLVAFGSTFGSAQRPRALATIESELETVAERAFAVEAQLETTRASLAAEALVAAGADIGAASDAGARIDVLRARCDRLALAENAVDAFLAWLGLDARSSGSTILSRVVSQIAFEDAATKHAAGFGRASGTRARILVVRTENAGGGYVTRKSLFAGLFSIPFFAGGGATISYSLFDQAGELVAADVVTVYGGLVRLGMIRDKLTGIPSGIAR